jgi:hypothetical protein
VTSRFADRVASAPVNGLNKALASTLGAVLAKYNDLRAIDKLAAVTGKVDDLKGVVSTGVEKALRNTTKLEELDDKTAHLSASALQFQQGGTALKRKMRCRYYKVTAIIVILVLAVLAYVLVPIIRKASDK